MFGIVGLVVIVLMTIVTVAGQLVIPVRMASRTRDMGVRLGQLKTKRCMVEDPCGGPALGCMARFACDREVSTGMVRVGRSSVIGHMASRAGGRQSFEFVLLLVFMTASASRGSMFARQRKSGEIVLDFEIKWLPAFGSMALVALFSKLAFVDIIVALVTLVFRSGELKIGMAGPAVAGFVLSFQREIGLGIVIKCHVLSDAFPFARRMAGVAGDRYHTMRILRLRFYDQRVRALLGAHSGS